ncbi:MAG: hypothetical protein NTY30_00520 [Candidatus Berkelbacteria bacterium]|nr:hypothetical protein [Candidatus Berkelbacteria bacterium]
MMKMQLVSSFSDQHTELARFLRVVETRLRGYPADVVSAEFARVVANRRGEELWQFLREHYPIKDSDQVNAFVLIQDMKPAISAFYTGPARRSSSEQKGDLALRLAEMLGQVEQQPSMARAKRWGRVTKSYIYVSSGMAYFRLRIFDTTGYPELLIRWNSKSRVPVHHRHLTIERRGCVKFDSKLAEEDVVAAIDSFLLGYYRDPSEPQTK